MKKDNQPSTKEYQDAVTEIIYSNAPKIYPCAKCGWPVENGYCCSTCGDSDPREPKVSNVKLTSGAAAESETKK